MSAAAGFSTKSYIFDPRPIYPYVSAVKRYWISDSPYLNDNDALTLIFTHGTGFHKEMLEPMIDDFKATNDNSEGKVKVREIWTIDMSNHGESMEHNWEELSVGPNRTFSWEEYGRIIHLFLNGLGKGVEGVDFSGHKLVGIGHSMGASSLAFSLGYYPQVKWHTLIFCEPMMVPFTGANEIGDMLVAGAERRKDRWASKEEAAKAFTARGMWKAWDPRIRTLFMEKGIVSLPTPEYPDAEGVTLACPKTQEAACYRDSVGVFRAFAYLKRVVQEFPTHLMYGAVDDYLSPAIKDAVINRAAGGIHNLASFSRIEQAGHMVPFTNPTGMARRIHELLLLDPAPLRTRIRGPKL